MTLSASPFLSVVLPTYNVEKYIDRCLASCANQTCKDIEIIVVDDGSKDSSASIATQWAAKDQRIKIVRNPQNLGTFHARRVGTEIANGAYILYLDPDDEISPITAEIITEVCADKRFDLLFTGVKELPSGKTHPIPKNTKSVRMEHAILGTNYLNYGTSGKIYRAEIAKSTFQMLKVAPNLRLTFAEDVLLLYTALCIAVNFRSIKQHLYLYHKNPESITVISDQNTTQYKINQIETVTELIKATNPPGADKSKIDYCKQMTVKHLMCVSLLLSRNDTDHHGNKIYVRNMLKLLTLRKSIKDLIRLAVYSFTFTKIRL